MKPPSPPTNEQQQWRLALSLNQSLRLMPNLIPKIHRIRRIVTRHGRQLARPIVDQLVGKLVPFGDILRGLATLLVAGFELLGIDGFEVAVGCADQSQRGKRLRG